MRASTIGVVAAGLAALGVSIILAGKAIPPVATAPSMATSARDAVAASAAFPDAGPPAVDPLASDDQARAVGDELVAPPPVQTGTLVRAEPRDPLSPLSQALPPPEPEITTFYRPVATASASFEAMGYRLAIAGTESVEPGETCTSGSIDWPCGVRARTAVRMWLRGRALNCNPPPKDKDRPTAVTCSLGKQDVGAWLVSNGWARAASGGPYMEAEAKARDAGMGIFGRPPAALPPETASPGISASDSIIEPEAAPDTVN